jgi:thymidylate synthase (FAD)
MEPTIKLLRSMGDDLTIVNAARRSFGRTSSALDEKDRGLIRALARDRHGSPFEHVVFTFEIDAPIYVAREWQRHRIGSFSELSLRYSEASPVFYHPTPRRQIGPAMKYTFLPLDRDQSEGVQQLLQEQADRCWELYKKLLSEGVAREVARSVLPVSIGTNFWWTVNLRSLFNFLSLRTHPSALFEIRRLAIEAERLAREVVPYAFVAFDNSGRTAP